MIQKQAAESMSETSSTPLARDPHEDQAAHQLHMCRDLGPVHTCSLVGCGEFVSNVTVQPH